MKHLIQIFAVLIFFASCTQDPFADIHTSTADTELDISEIYGLATESDYQTVESRLAEVEDISALSFPPQFTNITAADFENELSQRLDKLIEDVNGELMSCAGPNQLERFRTRWLTFTPNSSAVSYQELYELIIYAAKEYQACKNTLRVKRLIIRKVNNNKFKAKVIFTLRHESGI